MRTWVWSLVSLSGLGTPHCCEWWCRLQMWLRFCVAVAGTVTGSCSSNWTPSLGTSICRSSGPRNGRKTKRKKKEKPKTNMRYLSKPQSQLGRGQLESGKESSAEPSIQGQSWGLHCSGQEMGLAQEEGSWRPGTSLRGGEPIYREQGDAGGGGGPLSQRRGVWGRCPQVRQALEGGQTPLWAKCWRCFTNITENNLIHKIILILQMRNHSLQRSRLWSKLHNL